eukprot:g5494.t1
MSDTKPRRDTVNPLFLKATKEQRKSISSSLDKSVELRRKTSEVKISKDGKKMKFKAARSSIYTEAILSKQESERMPGRLKEYLKKFKENVAYEKPTIFDKWHGLEVFLVFMASQAVFSLYLKRNPSTGIGFFDVFFLAIINFVLVTEIKAIERRRLSNYAFYRALTQAGVILDFDNTDLNQTLYFSYFTLFCAFVVAAIAVLKGVDYGNVTNANGFFPAFNAFVSAILPSIGTIAVIGSSMNNLRGETSKLKDVEKSLLTINTFVEQNHAWASACFENFQTVSTSEALYKWMKINTYQRKLVKKYLEELKPDDFEEKYIKSKYWNHRELPQYVVMQNIFQLEKEQIQGLDKIVTDQEADFKWSHLRRNEMEPGYGHVVKLYKGEYLHADDRDIGEIVQHYESIVTNIYNRVMKKGNGDWRKYMKDENAKMRINTENTRQKIQQELHGEEISPQNVNDLAQIIPNYPIHLLHYYLKEANDDLLLALCNIIDGICQAKRKNGDETIEEENGPNKNDDVESDSLYTKYIMNMFTRNNEIDNIEDEEDENKFQQQQKYIYILNKNWWEADQWKSKTGMIQKIKDKIAVCFGCKDDYDVLWDSEDYVYVWIFENTGDISRNRLYDVRRLKVLKVRDSKERQFGPLREEKKVRELFPTSRVDKVMSHVHFGDKKLVENLKDWDYAAGVATSNMFSIFIYGLLFVSCVLIMCSGMKYNYVEGKTITMYEGYCGDDWKFIPYYNEYKLQDLGKFVEGYKKYMVGNENPDPIEDTKLIAVGCNRLCRYQYGDDSHYIGTIRNQDYLCMCSAKNCSKSNIINQSYFTTYDVQYEPVTMTYAATRYFIHFAYNDSRPCRNPCKGDCRIGEASEEICKSDYYRTQISDEVLNRSNPNYGYSYPGADEWIYLESWQSSYFTENGVVNMELIDIVGEMCGVLITTFYIYLAIPPLVFGSKYLYSMMRHCLKREEEGTNKIIYAVGDFVYYNSKKGKVVKNEGEKLIVDVDGTEYWADIEKEIETYNEEEDTKTNKAGNSEVEDDQSGYLEYTKNWRTNNEPTYSGWRHDHPRGSMGGWRDEDEDDAAVGSGYLKILKCTVVAKSRGFDHFSL